MNLVYVFTDLTLTF